jgi:hypothetical protein
MRGTRYLGRGMSRWDGGDVSGGRPGEPGGRRWSYGIVLDGCSRRGPDRTVRASDGTGHGVTALIRVPQLISGARVSPHVWSRWNVAKEHDCPMYSLAIQIVDPTGTEAP